MNDPSPPSPWWSTTTTTSRILQFGLSDSGFFSDGSSQHQQQITDPFASTSSSTTYTQTGIQQIEDVAVESVETAIILNLVIFFTLTFLYEILSRFFPSVYATRKHHGGSYISLPKAFLGWIEPVAKVTWNQVRKCGGLDAYMFLRYIRMCAQIAMVSGFWGVVVLFPIFATGGNDAEGWYHLSMSNISQGSGRLWVPAIFMWYMTFYVLFVMNEEYKHFVEIRRDYLARGSEDVHPQQQYSIMIENIPSELRSDKALYDYFNSLFPGKIYAARVVMNIPDLDDLSRRRARITRRLEKSQAIFTATNHRPTHVCGRMRCSCFGIETLPIIPYGGRTNDRDDDFSQTSELQNTVAAPPRRGERVDSINYYERQLALVNAMVGRLQEEKKQLASTGNEMVQASEWVGRTFEAMADAAVTRMGPRREDSMLIGFGDRSGGIIDVLKMGFSFFFGGCLIFNRELDAVVESAVGNAMSSTGFVTFKDRFTATCAITSSLNSDADVLKMMTAPEPRDIKWENAYISSIIINGREATVNVLLVIGVLLWSIPVAFIQAVATVESIASIPGMEWVIQFSGGQFASFINGYLPVIALLGLINLLPILFEWIATVYEDRKTHTDVEDSILGRFFYYQLANIYITVTAASAWDSLAEIINHPSNALWILGKTLPTVVGYFVSLLVTKILAGLPIVLLRPYYLLRMLFIKLTFDDRILTQRELDKVYEKQMLWYGQEYPSQLLVIVICFTYACISPIILPIGALYFLMAYLVYKKQVLVVYNPQFEGGGKMFPSVCHNTLIGLICAQITLTGYILIREGFSPVLTLLPLPFFTFRMIYVFQRTYAIPSTKLTLEMARDIDKSAEMAASTRTIARSSVLDSFDVNVYRQPVLAEKMAQPQPYRRKDSSSVASGGGSVGSGSEGLSSVREGGGDAGGGDAAGKFV